MSEENNESNELSKDLLGGVEEEETSTEVSADVLDILPATQDTTEEQ